jgi:hypothetical protein
MRHTAPTMRAHHDQIDVTIGSITDDLLAWRADTQRVFWLKLANFFLADERFELLRVAFSNWSCLENTSLECERSPASSAADGEYSTVATKNPPIPSTSAKPPAGPPSPRAGTVREFAATIPGTPIAVRQYGGRDDHTRQRKPRAVRLSMDSVPQAVGFPSAERLDPRAVHPDTRSPSDCDAEGLSRLQVRGTRRQVRELT